MSCKYKYIVIFLILLPVTIYSCWINPCRFEFCKNGGNCSLNENCNAECECQSGYSGIRCDVEVINGSDSNCMLCPDYQVCVETNGNWSCEPMSSTPTPLPRTTESDTTTSPKLRNSSWEVCSENYQNRTQLDRRCFGFECVYGKCNKTIEDINGIPTLIAKCDCDQGATGTKCEFQCCLDCGHGFCQYSISDQKPFCNCEPEYTGEYCQELRPTHGKKTIKKDI